MMFCSTACASAFRAAPAASAQHGCRQPMLHRTPAYTAAAGGSFVAFGTRHQRAVCTRRQLPERERHAPALAPAAVGSEPPEGAIELDIKVDGMVCGGCTSRVEEALKAAEGVQAVTVNLETGIATVHVTATDQLDAAANALPRLVGTVVDLGFEAEPYFD